MLRIHFTSLDLQSIRVARRPDPLWELVCAACRLVTRQGPLEFGAWRRGVLQRTARDLEARRALHLLGTLVPPVGYIPDFLTPSVSDEGLPAALEQVRATPRARLQQELAILGGSRPLPAWTTTLGRPGDRSMGSLVRALEVSSKTLLEPRWGLVRRAVHAEVDLRARTLLDGGVRALLESLRPFARWNPPVLEVDYPADRDLHLDGRGLLLLPSYFCWRRPTALADPTLGPLLVLPLTARPFDTVALNGGGLERLLGRTRASVLAQVARGRTRTTSEVAEAVGIALPSASYQLAVLRDGGLVASQRAGQFVRHSATAMGHQLLDTDARSLTGTDPAHP
ncbi:winged helix-turn-helix domain-containing protein [Streptomyces sp. NPDC005799]|uniref:ArsR/SmtB family transcription factor n=1 Tax=Streptomyces sp. NPDC005799 TaxID=3154678 RepID=UPI0033FA8F74